MARILHLVILVCALLAVIVPLFLNAHSLMSSCDLGHNPARFDCNCAPGIDIGTSNNNKLDLPASSSTNSTILPDRLIAVFGRESSGTSFFAVTIAHALGIANKKGKVPEDIRHLISLGGTSPVTNQNVLVHHLSLPLGMQVTDSETEHPEYPHRFDLPIKDVYYPEECFLTQKVTKIASRSAKVSLKDGHTSIKDLLPSQRKAKVSPFVNAPKVPAPKECRDLGLDFLEPYPQRHFLNITSHIRWYRDMGVDATAVIVVRDQSIHLKGAHQYHCSNATTLQAQTKRGIGIMQEAMARLSQEKGEILLVSYETMMMLQVAYLRDLYNRLGLHRATYIPEFEDGNAKYVVTASAANTVVNAKSDGIRSFRISRRE